MKLVELYQDRIMGAISGLDRIRFRVQQKKLPKAQFNS
ncbi:MAG: hypothetical protein HW390_543 [Candidatus Brocadiaceae bacterium]|nr:hypothetical protein [Candidatus Brocadiaceae bacterium]